MTPNRAFLRGFMATPIPGFGLYFFDSDGRDMSEVYRVLRSGGRTVIYVTSRETMTKWPFAGPETHKLYDRNELLDFLVDAGFQPSDVAIEDVRLPFGIKGLLATAVKSCCAPVSERSLIWAMSK